MILSTKARLLGPNGLILTLYTDISTKTSVSTSTYCGKYSFRTITRVIEMDQLLRRKITSIIPLNGYEHNKGSPTVFVIDVRCCVGGMIVRNNEALRSYKRFSNLWGLDILPHGLGIAGE